MSNPLQDRRTASYPTTQGAEGSHSDQTSEPNKAKVNRWVESEESDGNQGEKLYPNAPDPLRNVRDLVGTRPQTEPGRSREKQKLAGFVKVSAPKSVHDVTIRSSATADREKTAEKEEDWVVVEKPSTHDTISSDQPDQTSTVDASPKFTSSDSKDDVVTTHGTRVVTSNKFGSTFEVLPRANKLSDDAKETDTTEGNKDTPPVQAPPRRSIPLAHIGTFATAVTRWKSRRATAVGFNSLDPELRHILKNEADNIKTEIPEAMMQTIKEEAYRIVLKTTSAYRSQIGARHKLTREAYEYIKELREELKKP